MAERALAREDKQARRAVILSAARTLFNEGDGNLPTASQVAAASGLAKGTVYLYFQTKEEIFANLLLKGWIPVMGAVDGIFRASKGRRSDKVQAFIGVLWTTWTGTPSYFVSTRLALAFWRRIWLPKLCARTSWSSPGTSCKREAALTVRFILRKDAASRFS